jgi:hypothetical protein
VRQCPVLKQMKRPFPISLALLLVMSSWGNLFAAAFCPRMAGHNCCETKTADALHGSQSHHHMQGMAMDTMVDSMSMNGNDMPSMTLDHREVPPTSLASDKISLDSTSQEFAAANRMEPPIDACAHCVSHASVQNAPVSSLGVADHFNKDPAPALARLPRSIAGPAMTLSQLGLPNEHAPPGGSTPRYILISVFLI